MWFLFTIATLLLWGGADLFYKLGADEKDSYSHLKTSVTVGLVMGAHAIITMLTGNVDYDFRNLFIYLPVSMMYILSMTVGYLGLRYLEVSIASPIQNTSGAVVCIMCLLILGEKLDLLKSVAVIIICTGVFVLGLFERTREANVTFEDRKYRRGLKALLLPVLYCVFDALGTFFDAYYLDDFASTPLVGVTEDTFEEVANISYELTFLIVSVVLMLYLASKHEKLSLGAKGSRLSAAVFETAGQFTYVYAMSGKGVIAAPVISAYCAVSVLLGRVFLKEKLTRKQYVTVFAVVVGILLLGIAEGA